MMCNMQGSSWSSPAWGRLARWETGVAVVTASCIEQARIYPPLVGYGAPGGVGAEMWRGGVARNDGGPQSRICHSAVCADRAESHPDPRHGATLQPMLPPLSPACADPLCRPLARRHLSPTPFAPASCADALELVGMHSIALIPPQAHSCGAWHCRRKLKRAKQRGWNSHQHRHMTLVMRMQQI